MKKNEKKELGLKSKGELAVVAKRLRAEMKKIVIEINAKRLKNVSLLREKNKDLACILTMLREKELV